MQLLGWQKPLPAHPAGEFCHDLAVLQTGLYAMPLLENSSAVRIASGLYCNVAMLPHPPDSQQANVHMCLILLEASDRADALHGHSP